MNKITTMTGFALSLYSVAAAPSELAWSVSQVTHYSASELGSGNGAYSPDINNSGEVVYTLDSASLGNAQIVSLRSGQVTFAAEWHYAHRPRINNAGEIIFIAHTATQGSQGNPQIYRLSGERVDLGPGIIAANNLDFNDLGEVIGVGLPEAGVTQGVYSSTRGLLFYASEQESVGLSNTGTVAHARTSQALVPDGTQTFNFSINNLEEYVYQVASGGVIFWDGHARRVIASFGGEPRLNDRREIVFEANDTSGKNQVFYAAPVSVLIDELIVDVKLLKLGKKINGALTLSQVYYLAEDAPATCAQMASFDAEVRKLPTRKLSASNSLGLLQDSLTIQSAMRCQ